MRNRTSINLNNENDALNGDGIIRRSATAGQMGHSSSSSSFSSLGPNLLQLQDKMQRLKKNLSREIFQVLEFRVIHCLWQDEYQISDVFVTKSPMVANIKLNEVYLMRTLLGREYYIRVREDQNGNTTASSSYPVIRVNINLMALLELKDFERVILKHQPTIMNFAEKLELFAHTKTHYKIIENSFKRFISEKSDSGSVLLNQKEVIRLDKDLIVSVVIAPEHFSHCVIDKQFLKENKIYAVDVVNKVDNILNVVWKDDRHFNLKNLIKLPSWDNIVKDLVEELAYNLCLTSKNAVLRQTNILITGNS